MKLKPGDQICVVASRGDVLQMHVRRVQHAKSELMGGKVMLIQYGPTPNKLGPDEVEGTVFEADRGFTWDLGWSEETIHALGAVAALAGESEHDFNDIDLTESMEALLKQHH